MAGVLSRPWWPPRALTFRNTPSRSHPLSLLLSFSPTDVTSVSHWPRPHSQRESFTNSEVGEHCSCVPSWVGTRRGPRQLRAHAAEDARPRGRRARTTAEPTGVCTHPSGAPQQVAGLCVALDTRDPVLKPPVGACHSPVRPKPTQE